MRNKYTVKFIVVIDMIEKLIGTKNFTATNECNNCNCVTCICI